MVKRINRLLIVCGVALLASCAPAPTGEIRFPILGSDTGSLVDTMVWGGEEGPGFPQPDEFTEPLVSEEFTKSDSVVIFVQGGSCPPTAQVSVTGQPNHVTIAMNLGGSIEPNGVVCEPVLTTHSLIVYFKDPIDLDGLSVTSTRTGPPISEG